MVEIIRSILVDFWATANAMSPYLLLGFFTAGILSVAISPRFVQAHLGGKGIWPLLKASLFGIPLPLCSCGVIPVAMSLRKRGASKGATISFLLSTPQTGVDSFFVTFSLLGPIFAVFRPAVTFITGLLGGIGVELLAGKSKESKQNTPIDCQEETGNKKGSVAIRAFKYGFVSLPRDIGIALVVGLVLAGIISAAVPDDFFADKLGTGIGAMLLMMLLGIPVYVCATASVPVAAALMAKGLTPGAALVFLMTGPATNAASFVTIWKVLGGRTALIYFLTVAGCALGAGLVLDYIGAGLGTEIVSHTHEMIPNVAKQACTVILAGLLAFAVFGKGRD